MLARIAARALRPLAIALWCALIALQVLASACASPRRATIATLSRPVREQVLDATVARARADRARLGLPNDPPTVAPLAIRIVRDDPDPAIEQRRVACQISDPPEPPEFAAFARPGDYDDAGAITRYYVTARNLEDVVGWYKALRNWTLDVDTCLRALARDAGEADP